MKTISTKLLKEGDTDFLEFVFDTGVSKRVNINDPSDGTSLKSIFNDIVKICMTSDVTLDDLVIDPSSDGGLLAEVFKEYINDLNDEIGRVRAELRSDVADNVTDV